MKTYVFRRTHADAQPTLHHAVLAAMTELEMEGTGIELQTFGMQQTSDSDGDFVLARAAGPEGWHYHAGAMFERHRLSCCYYAV